MKQFIILLLIVIGVYWIYQKRKSKKLKYTKQYEPSTREKAKLALAVAKYI